MSDEVRTVELSSRELVTILVALEQRAAYATLNRMKILEKECLDAMEHLTSQWCNDKEKDK